MLGYVYKIVAGRPEARGFALEGRRVEAHLAADGASSRRPAEGPMRTPVEIRPRGGAQKPHREKALKEERYNVKRARSSAWIERRRSGSAGKGPFL
jgi:hypothetical protein